MKNIEIVVGQFPPVEEAVNLYVSVGWGEKEQYSFDKFQRAFESSNFILAYDGGDLVGLVRFMTDDAHETNVSEFLVIPAYQKKGIGKQLLQKLYKTYGHTDIYISTPKEHEEFFLKNGMFSQKSFTQVSRKASR